MTDELITYLSQISSIRVISYTSTYRYKDTQKGLPEIARELGVDGVVEGSVQRVGDRVRVNAQLVYAPQDSHLWAQSYERNLLDALAVQSTIAGTIADQIKLKLTPSQQARLRPARPVNLDALSAYLKGVDHYGRVGHGFGGEEIKKAVEFFEQAITEDPGFASPYVKLAQIYGEDPLPYLKESLPSQRSLIEKALSLDPNSSEIHTALGCLRFSKDWDWAGAESEFKRALELNSNDALAHLSLGEYWESMGRMEEGMRERERAQELDPANDYVSPGFFRARDYDREIAFLTKRLEVMPGDGGVHTQLSTCYAYKGMEKDAVAQLQQALVLFGFEDAAHHMVRAFTAKGYRGALYVLTRDMEGAYERGQFDRPDLLAEIYTRLGEKDKAFAWLQKAYEERSGAMVFLNAEPFWDPLRSDPRFKDLVRRVGLPDCCGKIAIALH
jgi:tetratricopeptide (TPR) repeat protein